MKVIIVGGVACGASCAARLRRLDEDAEIIILEKTNYISYANCGLPYYIGDIINDKNKLILQNKDSFWNRFRIEVRSNNEVKSIDKDNKKIIVKNLITSEEYSENYDKLVITTGAEAIIPKIDNINNEGIFTLKTVEDCFKIKEYIQEHDIENASIIGGGFIGLEMCESLRNLGINVSIIERDAQVLNYIDKDMASFMHSELRNNKVNLLLNTSLEKIDIDNNKFKLTLSNNQTIKTDLIILSVGIRPASKLAQECGLELDEYGTIKVDDNLLTSDENIYAGGDVVLKNNLVSNKKQFISLAGPANKQGRIIADNIKGLNKKYKGCIGSSILKLFNITVACCGLNEKELLKLGINYDKVVTFSPNHATYYPGSSGMTIKLLFNKDNGIILGGQIIGQAGVDKRIDVLTCAIYNKMNVYDLSTLDLAYAPPYSSGKDPLNIACYVATNVLDNLVEQYHFDEIEGASKNPNIQFVDVRTPTEYSNGTIFNAPNIPVDELRNHLDFFNKDKIYYINCQSALRSYIACRILTMNGIKCKNYSGGYRFFAAQNIDKLHNEKDVGPCGK